MIPIYPYQTQEVRDLAWACFSPPLLVTSQLADDGQNIANCGLPLTAQRRAWLEALDRDATALLQHLSIQRSHRLGVYFEHLWHFFLAHDPVVDLVAHNLPVRDGGRTLGEFDCIYYCHERQRHFHLELAVKFFLSHRQTTGAEHASHWSEWLGPNTDDRLDRKVEHLMQHQIQLGSHPLAQQRLQALGIVELAREVEIKGYLFQAQADPLPAPYGFNPEQHLSKHVRIGLLSAHLATLHAIAPGRYMILDKSRWLSPVLTSADSGLEAGQLVSELEARLARDERPQLVAAIDNNGSESRRFFVTAQHWPDLSGKLPVVL